MNFKELIENFKDLQMLQKMQYISDQQGIYKRYIREKENWDEHLKNSKDFILKSAQNKEKGKAVVLGSVWLLDLPYEELAKQFKELILIDIIHPKQIIRKLKYLSNVSFVKADITGGFIKYLYTKTEAIKNTKEKYLLPLASPVPFILPENTDFVISLNMLCQLHIILIDYLKSSASFPAQELNKLIPVIQQEHLNILPNGKSCLITNIEEEIYDEENTLIGTNPLMQIKLPEPNLNKVWQWKFDTLMTYREDAKTFFNTIAMDF